MKRRANCTGWAPNHGLWFATKEVHMSIMKWRLTSIVALSSALAVSSTTGLAQTAPDAAPLSPDEALQRAIPAHGKPPTTISFKRIKKVKLEGGAADTIWDVQAINGSSTSYDQVVLSFNRFSNPFSVVDPRSPFPVNSAQEWQEDDCADIDQFAVGLILNG